MSAMKQLIRRLSRVADSSCYILLRSDGSFDSRRRSDVPKGYLPVYVGEEMERYVVSAKLLNHPLFAGLLHKSAQEYGYEQPGPLRIPCSAAAFERLLDALRDHRLLHLHADDLFRLFSAADDLIL